MFAPRMGTSQVRDFRFSTQFTSSARVIVMQNETRSVVISGDYTLMSDTRHHFATIARLRRQLTRPINSRVLDQAECFPSAYLRRIFFAYLPPPRCLFNGLRQTWEIFQCLSARQIYSTPAGRNNNHARARRSRKHFFFSLSLSRPEEGSEVTYCWRESWIYDRLPEPPRVSIDQLLPNK